MKRIHEKRKKNLKICRTKMSEFVTQMYPIEKSRYMQVPLMSSLEVASISNLQVFTYLENALKWAVTSTFCNQIVSITLRRKNIDI